MSPIGGEKGSVQNPLIQYAMEIGWKYVSPEDALTLRGGESGLVFKEIFVSQIQIFNAFATQSTADNLVKKLETIHATIEGNFTVWEYLKGLKQVFVPAEKRERDVTLLNTSNVSRNTFHVTDEFSYSNGKRTIRADAIFLINGIPIIIAETKAAHKVDGIAEALDQLRRYHAEAPEVMAILQLFSVTHLIRYYYGATWNTSRKGLFNW
jgi:type I restriction enzyme R subunit